MSAQIAIISWFFAIVLGFFYFATRRERLVKNEIVDMWIKRGFLAFSIWLLTGMGGVVLQMASAASLSILAHEIILYVKILGWTGWAVVIYILFRTLIDTFAMYKISKDVERGLYPLGR